MNNKLNLKNGDWTAVTDPIVSSQGMIHFVVYVCFIGGVVVLLELLDVQSELSLLILVVLGISIIGSKMVAVGMTHNVHLAEIRDTLLQLAAGQGHADHQVAVGLMYYDGLGRLSQDYNRAHMWLDLAVSRLPSGDDQDLAIRYRDSAASKLTPAQLAEAQRLAREWKPEKE